MTLKKNCCLFVLLFVFMGFSAFAAPKDVYIAVSEIEPKSRPSFWGRSKGTLFYGDKVVVINNSGDWVEVAKDGTGISGWVKNSCITAKKIVANKKVSFDADEIALAGKGFSNALEAEYSNQYDIDFDGVDAIESFKMSNDEFHDFIVDGKLKGDKL